MNSFHPPRKDASRIQQDLLPAYKRDKRRYYERSNNCEKSAANAQPTRSERAANTQPTLSERVPGNLALTQPHRRAHHRIVCAKFPGTRSLCVGYTLAQRWLRVGCAFATRWLCVRCALVAIVGTLVVVCFRRSFFPSIPPNPIINYVFRRCCGE